MPRCWTSRRAKDSKVDSGFQLPIGTAVLAILSDQPPATEAVSPAAGAAALASRSDHKHERLTSATVQVLDGTGAATVTFTRAFAALPAVTCLLYEATTGQPVVFKVESWVMTGANYTGCVVRGYRASVLPSLSGILLIGPLLTALANYNVFGGSAAGAQFCCIALQPSA